MGSLSVAEAAARLGVGVARIHQRIADGSLPAERIGAQWVIDEALLAPLRESRSPGRPLSERSAWALLALSRSDVVELEGLAPSERSRARDRLQRFLARLDDASALEAHVSDVALALRSLLRKRAERILYRASPRDLPELRADSRIVLSGLSHASSGIASGDLVEGYVDASALAGIAQDYLLSVASVKNKANVVLHVINHAQNRVDIVSPLLLAADLADYRQPREEARSVEILREGMASFSGLIPLARGSAEGLRKELS